jgi:hypothetical protein
MSCVFHCNSGYANAPQCYVYSTLPVLLLLLQSHILITQNTSKNTQIKFHCGLDGPGIESQWRQDFPHPSRLTLGPTQPPIQ